MSAPAGQSASATRECATNEAATTSPAAAASSAGPLDLDVLLLQMSQKFNADLDGRPAASATAAASGSAPAAAVRSAATPAASAGRSRQQQLVRDDKTMKWRGLLKNQFASSASRRGRPNQGGARALGRNQQHQPQRASSSSSSTTAAATVSAQESAATANNEAACSDNDEPATVEEEAETTTEIAADKPQTRVLRRHASHAAPPTAIAARRTARPKVAAVAVASNKPAVVEPAETAVENAARTPLRRAGRPKRSQTIAAASEERIAAIVEPVVEPKRLRSRGRSAVMTAVAQPEKNSATQEAEKAESDKDVDDVLPNHEIVLAEAKPAAEVEKMEEDVPKPQTTDARISGDLVEEKYSKEESALTIAEADIVMVEDVKAEKEKEEEVKVPGLQTVELNSVEEAVVTKMGAMLDATDVKTEKEAIQAVDELVQSTVALPPNNISGSTESQQPSSQSTAIAPITSPLENTASTAAPTTSTTSSATPSAPADATLPAGPKKRGRKLGYRKPQPLHSATSSTSGSGSKKSARNSRDTDPAFDPTPNSSNSSRLAAELALALAPPPPQRLSRRIKPTAKILANDELRYGFELQNNARLSLSSEHLDAGNGEQRSPLKEEAPPLMAVATGNSNINGVLVAVARQNGAAAAAHMQQQQRRPAPNHVEFLHSIKMAKLNLHRSPDDAMRLLSGRQKRRFLKRKEKHLQTLGLQRRPEAQQQQQSGDGSRMMVAAAADEDDADEDGDFVPTQKVGQVGRPSVTLRLRANQTPVVVAGGGVDCDGGPTESGANRNASAPKKRTYAVIRSSSETSLILSTKHKRSATGSRVAVAEKADVAAAAGSMAEEAAAGQKWTGNGALWDSAQPSTATTNSTASLPAPIAPATAATAASPNLQCLCATPSQYYAHRTRHTVYCRAVDEIAGERIGCCNYAATTYTTSTTASASGAAAAAADNTNLLLNLRRASVRVPYAVLCAAHIARLRQHTSCAGCGVFCTHGQFAMCSARHLFHRDCATKFILSGPAATGAAGAAATGPQLVLRCPHCGRDAPECETLVTMRDAGGEAAIPVFVPEQRALNRVPQMSIGPHTYASAAAVAARSSATGKSVMWELERLLPAAVLDVVLRAECSAAAREAGGGQQQQQQQQVTVLYDSKDMYRAIGADDLEQAVRIISSADFDITSPLPETGRGTCLHLVANIGSLAMAYLLLSRAPAAREDFCNRRDRELRTALMCAVLAAKNDIVRMLVLCGADVTARGPGGMTALHLAAKTGNFSAAQQLLEAYRRATSVHRFALFVNAVDDGGWTTIVWAAEIGHAEMVEYLVQCGADLGVCDAERNTVLHWAALSDDVETVRPLLLGADLNVQNVNGDTPLHIACRNSNTRMCLIFLAHGASLELQNDLGETAFDGISDVRGPCARAVQFNMKLRAMARFEVPTVLCQDISNGREAYPIKVIRRNRNRAQAAAAAAAGTGTNSRKMAKSTRGDREDSDGDLDDDDENEVPHFNYIAQTIVLQNASVQIDRRISQMRVCGCVDNCTSSGCQCSEISVQNWYNAEGRLNGAFNYADPAMIFECSDVCGCNKLLCRNRVVQRGQTVALQVLDYGGSKRWGVAAVGDVARGTFVAEYAGEILTKWEANRRTDSSYYFDLDASQFCIDAHYYGNVSRFFNHSCEPNVVPIRVYHDHQDLRFPKIAFFAMRNIAANEEITFDYGEKFWLNRGPTLRCECRKPSCRFGGQPNGARKVQPKKPIASATNQKP